MVEACATALNQMGMLLSNHVARWVNCSETFLPRGSLSVTKNSSIHFCDCRGLSRLKHLTGIYPPYILRLVRPSLTNTGEQRGRGSLTNIMISSQVACDHHKVFRAELVSTPPDGLDTLTRSSKVRKR